MLFLGLLLNLKATNWYYKKDRQKPAF